MGRRGRRTRGPRRDISISIRWDVDKAFRREMFGFVWFRCV
jgi:hypothetical protein